MQELLYLYGFVIDGNTDDYLMVMAYTCILCTKTKIYT